MFEGHNPASKYRLRRHRAQSVVLTAAELVEVRAGQRTFEGAYIRTALGQFSFALIVLKIFTAEFYSIGALFAMYGTGIMVVGLYRRAEGNRRFFAVDGTSPGGGADNVSKKFRTSGNVVALLTVLSLGAYIALLILILRLKE